jgi:putative DNA primase/helicase
MDAQTISDALGGKRSGKGYRSACPVCGGSDKSTKFTMTDASDRVLVHCYAGCSFADISAELRRRGLWPDSTQEQKHVFQKKKHQQAVEYADTVKMIADSAIERGDDLSEQDKEVIEKAGLTIGGFVDTDMANAERFARLHAYAVFHTPECGWMIWDGKRWQNDEQGQVMQLAKQTARKIFSELEYAQNAQENKLFSWAKRSQSKDRLNAMLSLAQSEPGIPARITDFDADPMLLNCNNGVLNLATGELLPHNPARKHSKITMIDYDTAAQCPQWLAFLCRVMGDDDEMIDFLQRAVGYTLTGDTGEQCLFFTYGTGANGKSVFLEILLQLLAEYGTNARADTFMLKTNGGGIPNDIARLVGMRFVGISETESGQRMAESLVKDMTGGDTVTARFLHKEFFSFRPEFKLWIRGNHKPSIRGTDDGIWRRIHLIPFEVQIPPTERDPRLLQKLQAEVPGIFRWAVDGAMQWQQGGLRVPEKIHKATREYRTEMDRLADFIAEKCATGPGFSAFAGNLYKAYTDWCAESGERPMSQTAFGLALGERGYSKKTVSGLKKYSGIGLNVVDYSERVG